MEKTCLFWSSDLFHQQLQGAAYFSRWSLFDFQGYLHDKPLYKAVIFWKPGDVYINYYQNPQKMGGMNIVNY